jgi:hypothetical protein
MLKFLGILFGTLLLTGAGAIIGNIAPLSLPAKITLALPGTILGTFLLYCSARAGIKRPLIAQQDDLEPGFYEVRGGSDYDDRLVILLGETSDTEFLCLLRDELFPDCTRIVVMKANGRTIVGIANEQPAQIEID